MTIKELLETLHCGTKENISYRFYTWKQKAEFVFKNEKELLAFNQWTLKVNEERKFIEQEIEYFSFTCDGLHFELNVRIKEK